MFDGYRPSERITLTLFPDEFPPSPNSWTRRCINMYEYFTIFSAFATEGIQFASNQIFFAVHPDDFWIDEVSTQQGENQSTYMDTNIGKFIAREAVSPFLPLNYVGLNNAICNSRNYRIG